MSTSSWGRFSGELFPLSVPRAGKWGGCEANGLGSSTRSTPPAPPVPACSENKTPSAPGAAAGAGSTPPARSPPRRNTWPRLSRPCGGKAGGIWGGQHPLPYPCPISRPPVGAPAGLFPSWDCWTREAAGSGCQPVLQRRHHEAPGRQLRADGRVQGAVKGPNGVRAPTWGPRPGSSPKSQPQPVLLPKSPQAVGEDDQRVATAAGFEGPLPAHRHPTGACGEEKGPQKKRGGRAAGC